MSMNNEKLHTMNVSTQISSSSISFPKGAIIMWNGEPTDVPVGWAICDGENDTPNLVDRFIKGGKETSDTEKGSNKITDKNLPQHYHTYQKGYLAKKYNNITNSGTGSSNNCDIIDIKGYADKGKNSKELLGYSTTSTSTSGSSKPADFEPSHVVVCFIMKVVD